MFHWRSLILYCFVFLIPNASTIVTSGRNTTAQPSGNRHVVAYTREPNHGYETSYVASYHSLQGFTNAFVFRKCCPSGRRLNSQLERCEKAVSEAPTPFPAEWITPTDDGGGVRDGGEEGAPNAGCDATDTLRLSAEDALRRVRLESDGSLLLSVNGTLEQQVHLLRDEFCADESSKEGSPWAMLLCPCDQVICVRKCCPRGHILKVWEVSEAAVETKCYEEPREVMWTPPFIPMEPGEALEVLFGAWPTECTDGFTRIPPGWADPNPNVKPMDIQPNGSVVVGYKIPVLMENFCIDFERNRNGVLSESLMHCASPLEVPLQDAIVAGVSFLGVFALLMVIATYCLLPELRTSAFGRSLLCYASCLLFAFLVGIWLALAPDISNVRCVFTLTMTQFFHLSAAFWLNAMCFDMGLAFSLFQLSNLRGASADRRFFKYSLYAWTGPTVLCVIMIAMQLSLPSGHPYRPLEWYMACKYFTKTSNLVFFYGPMLLIVLSNFVLLVYIAWQIRQLQKDRKILEDTADSSEACPYTGKKKLMLFTRLLWGMGVVETTLEIITWTIGSHIILWHVTNVVDMSRAFCLFALVCCKRRVWDRLVQRFRSRPGAPWVDHRMDNRLRPTTGTTSTTFSSTSMITISNEGSIFRNSGKIFRFKKITSGRKRGTEKLCEEVSTSMTSTGRNSGEVIYSVPKGNKDTAKQTMSVPDASPAKKVKIDPTTNVDTSTQTKDLSGYNMNEAELPLELGDLSNSASNSPFAKTFPDIPKNSLERGTSGIEHERDSVPVRMFLRSSSKVMNNPIFETSQDSSKKENGASSTTNEEPSDVPEMSVVDDDIPITGWGSSKNQLVDNNQQEIRSVSVTSL